MKLKPLIIALLQTSEVKTTSHNAFKDYDCETCISKGGNQCLYNKSYDTGICCDPKVKTGNDCKYQYLQTVCASESSIKNELLQKFSCPLKKSFCTPLTGDVYVTIKDKTTSKREIKWDFTVPDAGSDKWHCKYEIKSDPDFLKDNKNGYIMVQTEMYGADESINIIVQKKKMFKDLVPGEDSYALPKIYQNAPFSHSYYIPAEYDIYLSFAPLRLLPGASHKDSPMGKFQFQAMWLDTVLEQKAVLYDDNTVLFRSATDNEKLQEAIKNAKQKAFSEADVKKKADAKKTKDDKSKNDDQKSKPAPTKKKVNWNGEEVKNEPWYEKTLFVIDDIKVTEGEAAIGTGTLLVIIFVSIAVCAFCCDWKHKEIGRATRRLSASFRSSSVKKVQDGTELPQDSFDPNDSRVYEAQPIKKMDIFNCQPEIEIMTNELNIENILKKFELIAQSKTTIEVGDADPNKTERENMVTPDGERIEDTPINPEFDSLINNTKYLLNQISKKDESLRKHHSLHMYAHDFEILENQNVDILNNIRKMSEIKFKGDAAKQKEVFDNTEKDLTDHYRKMQSQNDHCERRHHSIHNIVTSKQLK